MSTIMAKVIADSLSQAGIRLTTLQLRYPRFIHAEFMTHRVFSRNASSSRAIPVDRLIADVELDPAMPMHWGRNRPGMQAREELAPTARVMAEFDWRQAARNAVRQAAKLKELGCHKQLVNRILEPYSHINVVVTATDWDNFFSLRRHKDAQPEMQALAEAMFEALTESTPRPLEPGTWHLPYVTDEEWAAVLAPFHETWVRDTGELIESFPLGEGDREIHGPLIKLSVARCARVSYLTHDGAKPAHEADLALFDRLMKAEPRHASPAEHQATPDHAWVDPKGWGWEHPELHGNLVGWVQFRKFFEREVPPPPTAEYPCAPAAAE